MNKRLWAWLHAWVNLVSALASVLTFGLWWPRWEMKLLVWKSERDFLAWQSGQQTMVGRDPVEDIEVYSMREDDDG